MKVKLANENFDKNYIQNFLQSRGINDAQEYINAGEEYIADPFLLENIEKGLELLNSHLNDKILIVQDCDCDGITSAAIIYQYIKDLNDGKEDNLHFIIHNGKAHGLEDLINEIVDKDYDLVIQPDSGTNDWTYHKELVQNGASVLVLDHHDKDENCMILDDENVVIINNQLSPNYENKFLSGSGVTWQFCRAYDLKYNKNYSDKYIDLAALGIISDMMDIRPLENRAIIRLGLNNIKSKFFRHSIEKQSFSMGGKVSPITVAFYIVPLINALIRVGSKEEKENLFLAFIHPEEKIPSKKRGAKGELEFRTVESIRECTNAKSRQNKIKDKAVDSLEIKIMKYDLLDNKILVVVLDEEDDFPSELNGLIANILAQKYKIPTLIVRPCNDNILRGSARGLSESELDDLKQFLLDSKLVDYAQGHPCALGVGIPTQNLSSLLTYSNEKLAEFNFAEKNYLANFERIAADADISDIINEITLDIYGQGNPEPLLYIKDINLMREEIQICGKNNDTVRFVKFGITYIKFKAKDLIEDLQGLREIKMEVIGRPNINEWGGKTSPQIVIEDYNIKNGALLF